MKAMVKTEGLHMSYGTARTLKDIGLEVARAGCSA